MSGWILDTLLPQSMDDVDMSPLLVNQFETVWADCIDVHGVYLCAPFIRAMRKSVGEGESVLGESLSQKRVFWWWICMCKLMTSNRKRATGKFKVTWVLD